MHAYPLLQIDKPLLAATLYNLSCQAEKKDIGIQFEIRNPVPKFISSDEITNFFKNGYTTKALIEKRDNVPHGAGLNNLLKSVTEKFCLLAGILEF